MWYICQWWTKLTQIINRTWSSPGYIFQDNLNAPLNYLQVIMKLNSWPLMWNKNIKAQKSISCLSEHSTISHCCEGVANPCPCSKMVMWSDMNARSVLSVHLLLVHDFGSCPVLLVVLVWCSQTRFKGPFCCYNGYIGCVNKSWAKEVCMAGHIQDPSTKLGHNMSNEGCCWTKA